MCIFLTLKLQRSNLANAFSFSLFQNTSHRETNRSSYISRAVSNIIRWEQPLEAVTFSQRDLFSEYKKLSGAATSFLSLFLSFLISNLLQINTFSAQLLFRRSFLSRLNNYSIYVLFRSKYLFWCLLKWETS